MRVYIDDTPALLNLFKAILLSPMRSRKITEQLFKSLRGGGFFSISERFAPAFPAESYARRDAPATDGRSYVITLRRRHTERRAVLKEGVPAPASATHRHFVLRPRWYSTVLT